MSKATKALGAGFDYRCFGLDIRSEIMLPELSPSASEGEPDICIHIGKVPRNPAGPGGTASKRGDDVILSIDDVGRYLIRNGSQIVVDRDEGTPDANVRLFLLGSAMGALLHQRGLLPLHANAVEVDGMAVAFMGRSGSGKSTLAAWFHDHDYPLIGDDVCVVTFDREGRALTSPSLRRIRLWKDALAETGRRPDQFERSYADDDRWEKYDVPVGEGGCSGDRRMAALYLLEEGDEQRIVRLSGLEAADAVFANTYRGEYVQLAGNARTHWNACLSLIRQVPVFRAIRPWGFGRLDEATRELVAHARIGIGAASDRQDRSPGQMR